MGFDPIAYATAKQLVVQTIEGSSGSALKGADGFSPIVDVTEHEDGSGYDINIKDAKGDHKFTVKNGVDGGAYKTGENQIGSWIDGKPIYRMVLSSDVPVPMINTSNDLKDVSGTDVEKNMYSYTNKTGLPIEISDIDLALCSTVPSNQGFVAAYDNDKNILKENVTTTDPRVHKTHITIPGFTLEPDHTLKIAMGFPGEQTNVMIGFYCDIEGAFEGIDEYIRNDETSSYKILEYTKL